jgi:hypothetical protein
MKAIMLCTMIIAASVLLCAAGCKPATDSSSGKACFVLYSTGSDNARTSDITTAKVGQEVGADISCAGKCRNNFDMSWGDGDYGESLTHTYSAPGTFTVKYACSDRSPREQRRDKKHKKYFGGGRFESEKTITITP